MPDPVTVAKAELIELDAKLEPLSGGKKVAVQFNPETLKVTFANQVVTPDSPGSKNGTSTQQFVGAGSTKLGLQIWFDLSSLPDGAKPPKDVRALTSEVIYFITPQVPKTKPAGFDKTPAFRPPMVRFHWGTFVFDGLMDSLEENLDLFSPEGAPLRSSIAFTLSQQRIPPLPAGVAAGHRPPLPFGSLGAAAGAKPLTPAPSGSSLQSLADGASGGNWQAIAAANGIENPRLLDPGQLLDLNPF